MIYLRKPVFNELLVYVACISNVQDDLLLGKLASIKSLIEVGAAKYDSLGETHDLYKMPVHSTVNNSVTRDDLVSVYTERMAKKSGPGRSIYDKLKAAPAHNVCPLCNLRPIATLDHYLPKAHYPIFSVVTLNLVPACRDCNTAKLDKRLTSREMQTLHPYYDNIQEHRWLAARLMQTVPASMNFFVHPPGDWDRLIADRVNFHFDTFGLNMLYASQAATEIAGIRHMLQTLHSVGGATAVSDHLHGMAKSWLTSSPNSWQAASYTAMASNNWYCSIGHSLF